ncbi:LysR family transcriptional regulator [Trinickia soli]|jgi:DNA-binding transcriptional LysR family regulator|uniref:LysR family transcriptional regulator n=1 Tax=Trinickia soli TaxID=380675 RepID=A0A2N7WEM5_9BURK|nr:LysR family transcriptional regulator [Trinickia soli]PMS27837.1 LysR family transcriptional regulator [Trinickia soli]CAB3655829.1 HTH-type transcriptional regulator HdfR [Trinickia soli]
MTHPLNFDMDALRTMVVGVELGGFSHAAARLHRSPSAISMQLRKLESQAGQRLFQRKGRGLVLTEAGDVLLQYARRVLALNDELGAALGAVDTRSAVRLGIAQDFADVILQDLLSRYAVVRPRVQVEIKAGRNFEFAADVASGKLDVAVAFALPGNGGGTRIATVPAVWLGCEATLHRAGAPSTVPLAVFDGPCLFRDMSIDSLSRAGVPWRLSMTTPSLASLWCGVLAGLGVTVRTALALPAGLAVMTGAPPLGAVDIVLHCAARCASDARVLADLLRETVSAQCGALEMQRPSAR